MRLTHLVGAALGTGFLFLAAAGGAQAYDHHRERERDHWRHEEWRHDHRYGPLRARAAGRRPRASCLCRAGATGLRAAGTDVRRADVRAADVSAEPGPVGPEPKLQHSSQLRTLPAGRRARREPPRTPRRPASSRAVGPAPGSAGTESPPPRDRRQRARARLSPSSSGRAFRVRRVPARRARQRRARPSPHRSAEPRPAPRASQTLASPWVCARGTALYSFFAASSASAPVVSLFTNRARPRKVSMNCATASAPAALTAPSSVSSGARAPADVDLLRDRQRAAGHLRRRDRIDVARIR